MIADPSTREGRVAMLKQGYSEREIGDIYNHLRGNIMVSVNWDALEEHWEKQYCDDYLNR